MKPQPRLTPLLLNLLDLVEDAMFIANRPSLYRLNRYWGYAEERTASRALRRWESQQYLEKMRRGGQVFYCVGTRGKQLLQHRRPSPTLRQRTWDGRWRILVFDFPETARKARDAFRHTLLLERMGCLQKSVWITPDPVIPEWKRLLIQSELTKWVLLFESAELGSVDDREIARMAWPLDELEAGYQGYLSENRSLPRLLRAARPSALAEELGRAVRQESRSYFSLLQQDPLLPSALIAADSAALAADVLHSEIRTVLREVIFGDA